MQRSAAAKPGRNLIDGRARLAAHLLGALSSLWIAAASGQPHVIGPREDIESADVTRALTLPEDAEAPGAENTEGPRRLEDFTASGPIGWPDKSFAVQIEFSLDSAELSAAGQRQLDAIAKGILDLAGQPRVAIEGYTDASGSDRYNDELSLRRAKAVRDYLVGRGLPKNSLEVAGRGRRHPRDAAHPGSAVNRRIEFHRLP